MNDKRLLVGRRGHWSRVVVKRNDKVAGQKGRRRRWKRAERENRRTRTSGDRVSIT